MELHFVAVEKPEEINFILGQSHFIKTVEDLHETLVSAVPGIKFGAGLLRGVRQMPGALVGHRPGDDRAGPKERPGDWRGAQFYHFPG